MAEIFIGNKVDDPPKIAGRYTKHKNNVLKYIYFESPIKINNDYYTVYLDTQRVKNQDPTLLDLYNIRVKKNVLTGTNLIAFPQGQVNNSGILPNLSTIYLQTVYHGSGANFERFNTEQYGLSGEGSMSFGYGTYLTDSEEIARDYAERNRKKIEKMLTILLSAVLLNEKYLRTCEVLILIKQNIKIIWLTTLQKLRVVIQKIGLIFIPPPDFF